MAPLVTVAVVEAVVYIVVVVVPELEEVVVLLMISSCSLNWIGDYVHGSSKNRCGCCRLSCCGGTLDIGEVRTVDITLLDLLLGLCRCTDDSLAMESELGGRCTTRKSSTNDVGILASHVNAALEVAVSTGKVRYVHATITRRAGGNTSFV